ncbi:MAG: tetratricopeptide repeat protein [Burkholderiales bacterium]|nr:tetratricopeptide repeat protein [Burkholderiales bacterium]
MAHLNLDEQEQISKLKYFWRDYGKYLIGFLLVIIVAYASSELWTYKSEINAKEAAIVYAKFTDALNNKDIKSVYANNEKLEKDYPTIEYSAFASLIAAKVAFTNGELVRSATYLKWLISNTKDKGLIAIAKIRLADVYIDQKNTKAALALMMGKAEPQFKVLFYEKMGDLYVVTNDNTKAIDAYKLALEFSPGNDDLAQVIKMKLDTLGH